MSALGVAPLAAGFRDGSDDPVRALERCLSAAERAKDDRALLWLRADAARAEAEAARARFAAGSPRGPLDGVPLVVKDCIDVAGLPTTNGTAYRLEPAAADAQLVGRLHDAGAVVFAKANMHEFGCQPLGINPHHGTPRNPWGEELIPGGSSAGPAVAVASGVAPVAVGTDAGGSVRVPAALNGLVGLKPTFGAVPDEGVAKLTKDLDHVGPIAWTVEDATLVFEVLSGRTVDRTATPGSVAVLADFFTGAEDGIERAVRAAAEVALGPAPDEPTPMCRWAAAVEFVVVGTDAAELMRDDLAAHRGDLGPDARTILQLGGGLTAEDRRRADGVRRGMRDELARLLERYDVLVGPATGSRAPRLHPAARRTSELDTATMARLAAVTFVANLTGLPCCVVPCDLDGAPPLAMQIIGRAGDEARVLAAARAVAERFPARRPPRWFGA